VIVLICSACREPWEGPGSPAVCPKCGVANFAVAVERNVAITAGTEDESGTGKEACTSTSTGGGTMKMTMKEVVIKFISGYADKKDWIRLDTLNQWATSIPDYYIMKNLKARYREVNTSSLKYGNLLEELSAELKNIGIEYRSDQLDVGESVGSFIEREIDSRCGEYFRQDIRRRIQDAGKAERKLLYLYARYLRPSQSIRSVDLSPNVWRALFEATFGPTLSNSIIDILRWFNVCNHYLAGKRGYWCYDVPKYATQIVDNVEDFVEDFMEVPEITDAQEAYVTNLVSKGNIPRLALLEIILSQVGDGHWVDASDIKRSFELLYPVAFEKYSQPVVGVLAKIENVFCFCPFTKEKILREILETKKNMSMPLLAIFDGVRDKIGRGDINFQDKLAGYGGFINLASRATLYFVITPWLVPPQSRDSRGYLQQLPWIYDHTPCVILTTDDFRPALIMAIQGKGLKDICLASFEEKAGTLDLYCFGASIRPFDELLPVLRGLGYQVSDRTKQLRETWYPLEVEAVANFSDKFTTAELEANRNFEFQPGRFKGDRIRNTIEKYGLPDFARRIRYPFYYDESGSSGEDRYTGDITVTSETGEPIASVPVSVGSSSRNTDKNGYVMFSGLSSGKYKVTVTASGFKPYEGDISIPQERERTICLAPEQVPQEFLVSIVVKDKSSEPLDGVLVNFGSVPTKMTDSNGAAEFQMVTGTYQLDLTKEGYSRISQRIEVVNAVQLNYSLNRISAPTYSITFPPYSTGTTLVFGRKELEGKIAWGYEIGKPLSYDSIVTSDLTDMNEGHIGFFMSVRSGKSTLAASAILQAAFQSIPVVVIDPKPDYVSNMIPLSDGLEVTDAFTKGIAPRFENVRQDKRGFDLWQPVSFDYQGRKNELLFQIVTFTKERKALPRTVQYKAPLLTLPSPEDEDFQEQCDEAATSLTQDLPKAEGKGFNTLISKGMQQFRLGNIQREFLLADDLLKTLDSLEDETFTSRDVRSLKRILSDYQTGTSTFFAKEREQVSDIRELLNPKPGVTPITILDVSGLPAKGKSAAQQNFISQVCGQIYHYAQKNRGTRAVELLLVLDEAQGYLPDPTNQYNFVRKLIQEGPSLGIRVILISQTPQDIEMTARQQLKTLILSNVPEGTVRYVAETFSLPTDWRHKLNRAGRGTPLIINEKTAKTGGALCNTFTSPQMVGLLTREQIEQAMNMPQAEF